MYIYIRCVSKWKCVYNNHEPDAGLSAYNLFLSCKQAKFTHSFNRMYICVSLSECTAFVIIIIIIIILWHILLTILSARVCVITITIVMWQHACCLMFSHRLAFPCIESFRIIHSRAVHVFQPTMFISFALCWGETISYFEATSAICELYECSNEITAIIPTERHKQLRFQCYIVAATSRRWLRCLHSYNISLGTQTSIPFGAVQNELIYD